MRNKLKRHSEVSVDVQRILADDTPFAVKEAYRTLYTNVIYLPIEDKCKKLVITSAFPGEGKTSISINLAYSIAMNSPESKVLIVDADMRSPRVTELLNIHEKLHGLSEYLAGIDKQPNFVPIIIHPNLSLLAAGAKNINSPGLISSSRMDDIVKIFDETFDYVIFDTPPVNIVSDAMLLSDKVNGYIIATRADYSDINSLSEAIDNLRSADGIIHGVVLCSYNAKTGGYGKYGKYGKYGNKYGKYESEYGKGEYGAKANETGASDKTTEKDTK